MKVETEYGLRPHYLQTYLQAAHIVLSPLLIFVFGMLLKEHIVKMYRNAFYKRKSGILLVLTMIIMIISGYLVQVIYAQDPKLVTAYIHIGVSTIFFLTYVTHHFIKLKVQT